MPKIIWNSRVESQGWKPVRLLNRRMIGGKACFQRMVWAGKKLERKSGDCPVGTGHSGMLNDILYNLIYNNIKYMDVYIHVYIYIKNL